jgi:hypothetical protein
MSEHLNPAPGTPFRSLLDHCLEHGLQFTVDHETQSVRVKLLRQHAIYNTQMRITNDDTVLQIHIGYPVNVRDPKLRPLASEFFSRANFGLILGAFEFDYRDGEVRYHLGHLLADGQLAEETIRHLMTSGLSTADRYFPAFMRVLFAGETPEDAIFLAELDLHTEGLVEAGGGTPALPGPSAPSEPEKPRAARKKKTKPGSRTKPRKDSGPTDSKEPES